MHELLAEQPAAQSEPEWDEDFHRQLFAVACDRVRPEFQEATWLAFWRVAVGNESAREVADGLCLTLGAVYIAKSRVLARLKEEINVLRDE